MRGPPRFTSEQLVQSYQDLLKRIVEFRDTNLFKEWLTYTSRFYQYSPFNTALILICRPDATRIAGFRRWIELGRYVRKGEQGCPVLCPRFRVTEEFDRATGLLKRDPLTGETIKERKLVGYLVGYVFDVKQTEGPPVPELPAFRGEAGADQYDVLVAVAEKRSVPVLRQPLELNLGGYTDGRTIVVNSSLSLGANAGTMAHELAHIQLQHPQRMRGFVHDPRSVVEQEAEAATFIIAQALGIERRSEIYIAAWAKSDDLRLSMEKITSAARDILNDAVGVQDPGATCEIDAPAVAP